MFVQSRCVKRADNSHTDSPASKRAKLVDGDESKDRWLATFEPRSGIQPVRNCQLVARETKNNIVQKVFDRVLLASDAEVVSLESGKTWRKGGTSMLMLSDEVWKGQMIF